jgi:xanthine dehydrogenase molybdopterin-binding subunit B
MQTRACSPPKLPSASSRRRSDSERLEAQLAEWTAVIAQCRASAHRAAADARIEFDRIADELQLLRNEAGAQVTILKGSMDLDWEDSVSALECSWQTVRSTFQAAEAKL